MKLAAAAYPLDFHADWDAYEAKLTAWVCEAADHGADLLVFPEYGAMELASLDGEAVACDMEAALRAVDRHLPAADALHQRLTQEYAVHILAGSGPVYDPDASRPVNRARLFGPQGQIACQDKQIMTMDEREEMQVRSGGPLHLFQTELGKVGVLICYDIEFPALARGLVEAGAEILLVPSFTESLAGYWRVRIGAMARALEGQCVTVQAPCIGLAPGCPAMGPTTGAAAIYGPPDLGFPPTGVLAEGAMNHPGWVYADLPTNAVAEVRAKGHVRNFSHWPEQAARLNSVKSVNFQR